MKTLIAILLLYPLIAQAGWWPFKADEWEGFVYPDKHDSTVHKNLGAFQTLESCRSAARNMLSEISSLEKGDYECGLNCEFREGMGDLRICEKTER